MNEKRRDGKVNPRRDGLRRDEGGTNLGQLRRRVGTLSIILTNSRTVTPSPRSRAKYRLPIDSVCTRISCAPTAGS